MKTLSELDHEQVSEEEGNVGLMVNNDGAPSRVTVRLDDTTVLDVELPDSQDCSHSPLYTYYYKLPAGKVEVEAVDGAGTSKTKPLVIDERMMWIVVSTQENFPVHLGVSREMPAFG